MFCIGYASRHSSNEIALATVGHLRPQRKVPRNFKHGRNAPTNCSKPPTLPEVLRITVTLRANYLGVSRRFASSCTDFVVADLSIADLAGRPQAAGGFVICLANTR